MKTIIEKHKQAFGHEPQVIVSAPGRVNLIGEHTDYNDGFVFPAAIDRAVLVAVSLRNDSQLSMLSLDFDERHQTDLLEIHALKDSWANYPMGLFSIMQKAGYSLGGVNLTVTGNVPVGSGLSSSAAVEVATGFAVQNLFDLGIKGEELAQLAQRAENQFVGVQCGIMDQFISRLGREGHAMLLDCRSLEYRHVPLQLGDARLLISNTKVPRGLVDSEYNDRRNECQRGVELLNKSKKGKALRDFTAEDILRLANIPESTKRKCLHVVEENQRVLEAELALKRDDLAQFGQLMNQSHQSLRDQYQVSCKQLDWLVERAGETQGVYGSRMTGAGFGGCTVTLIEEAAISDYQAKTKPYETLFGIKPEFYVCRPSSGAQVVHRISNVSL